MAKGKVGRPSKLDKDTMKEANISFIIHQYFNFYHLN